MGACISKPSSPKAKPTPKDQSVYLVSHKVQPYASSAQPDKVAKYPDKVQDHGSASSDEVVSSNTVPAVVNGAVMPQLQNVPTEMASDPAMPISEISTVRDSRPSSNMLASAMQPASTATVRDSNAVSNDAITLGSNPQLLETQQALVLAQQALKSTPQVQPCAVRPQTMPATATSYEIDTAGYAEASRVSQHSSMSSASATQGASTASVAETSRMHPSSVPLGAVAITIDTPSNDTDAQHDTVSPISAAYVDDGSLADAREVWLQRSTPPAAVMLNSSALPATSILDGSNAPTAAMLDSSDAVPAAVSGSICASASVSYSGSAVEAASAMGGPVQLSARHVNAHDMAEPTDNVTDAAVPHDKPQLLPTQRAQEAEAGPKAEVGQQMPPSLSAAATLGSQHSAQQHTATSKTPTDHAAQSLQETVASVAYPAEQPGPSLQSFVTQAHAAAHPEVSSLPLGFAAQAQPVVKVNALPKMAQDIPKQEAAVHSVQPINVDETPFNKPVVAAHPYKSDSTDSAREEFTFDRQAVLARLQSAAVQSELPRQSSDDGGTLSRRQSRVQQLARALESQQSEDRDFSRRNSQTGLRRSHSPDSDSAGSTGSAGRVADAVGRFGGIGSKAVVTEHGVAKRASSIEAFMQGQPVTAAVRSSRSGVGAAAEAAVASTAPRADQLVEADTFLTPRFNLDEGGNIVTNRTASKVGIAPLQPVTEAAAEEAEADATASRRVSYPPTLAEMDDAVGSISAPAYPPPYLPPLPAMSFNMSPSKLAGLMQPWEPVQRKAMVVCNALYSSDGKALQTLLPDVKALLDTLFTKGFRKSDVVFLHTSAAQPPRLPTRANTIAALHWLLEPTAVPTSLLLVWAGPLLLPSDDMGDVNSNSLAGYQAADQKSALAFELCAKLESLQLPPSCRLHCIFDTVSGFAPVDFQHVAETSAGGWPQWQGLAQDEDDSDDEMSEQSPTRLSSAAAPTSPSPAEHAEEHLYTTVHVHGQEPVADGGVAATKLDTNMPSLHVLNESIAVDDFTTPVASSASHSTFTSPTRSKGSPHSNLRDVMESALQHHGQHTAAQVTGDVVFLKPVTGSLQCNPVEDHEQAPTVGSLCYALTQALEHGHDNSYEDVLRAMRHAIKNGPVQYASRQVELRAATLFPLERQFTL